MRAEHALQVAVAHMLRLVLDPGEVWWTAIDHGAGKLSPRAAGSMKARGVRAGIPDFLFLPKGRPALGIELKTERGHLSLTQVAVAHDWLAMGTLGIYVARSLVEVQAVLEHCRIPMTRRLNFVETAHDRHGRAGVTRYPRARRKRKSKNAMPLVL